jgi:4-hydroxy-tetrahydrodipicolinate synthase
MKDLRFTGTGVAIITPFKNQSIDYPALSRIIDHVIEGGVQFIVALGSTGEAATLTDQECRDVLDHCIDKINRRVPLMAGNFGGNDTRALVEKIKSYDFNGIDAILSASPAYVKPTQEGIFQHYMALAEASPLPIMLYNVPGRTRSNMEWHTSIRLAEASKKFLGIKEASGDLVQVSRILHHRPDHFIVSCGDDELALPFLASGGDGVISVMANVLPDLFSQMVRYTLQSNINEAQKINAQTYDLNNWLYAEGNPTGIKAAMECLGLCSRETRLPLCQMTDASLRGLKAELDKIILNF